MIKLYHGSNQKIEVPDLVHSKPFKDFGRGFYLSANKQQALDMAFQKVSQTQLGNAEVTEFLFDETEMQSPDLKVLTYQLRRYEGGVISLQRLVEELKYAKGITFQYYFGTERALKLLKRL